VRLYCEAHGVCLDLGPGRRSFSLDPGRRRATDCALLRHPDPRPGQLPRPDRWGRPTEDCCEVIEV